MFDLEHVGPVALDNVAHDASESPKLQPPRPRACGRSRAPRHTRTAVPIGRRMWRARDDLETTRSEVNVAVGLRMHHNEVVPLGQSTREPMDDAHHAVAAIGDRRERSDENDTTA